MFNNLFNQIIVLVIGVNSLTNTYANIEYFTSAAPSMYGEPLTKKIGIIDGHEFYLKNTNYDVNEINNKNRGIGYIEGGVTQEIYEEYIVNFQNFDKFSKTVQVSPLRGNKLNVFYKKNDKEIIKSIPFNFFVKNDDAKKIKSWFNRRGSIISNSENYTMKTGFSINYIPIIEQDNFLLFKLSFVNNGDSNIKILDAKDWKKNELEKKQQNSVKLVLKSDHDFFQYYINEDNLINNKQYKEGLIIPKKSSLDLEFKINKEKLSNFYEFRKNNLERIFVSYVSFDLSVISPISIKGKFLYETSHFNFK